MLWPEMLKNDRKIKNIQICNKNLGICKCILCKSVKQNGFSRFEVNYTLWKALNPISFKFIAYAAYLNRIELSSALYIFLQKHHCTCEWGTFNFRALCAEVAQAYSPDSNITGRLYCRYTVYRVTRIFIFFFCVKIRSGNVEQTLRHWLITRFFTWIFNLVSTVKLRLYIECIVSTDTI